MADSNEYGRILNERMHAHSHGNDCDSGHHDHEHDLDPALKDSLYSKIDIDNVVCLNEKDFGTGKLIFKPFNLRLDTSKFVESDCEEEILLHVPFTGMVKLKSIVVWGGPGNCAPKKLKVIINRDDIDFDNVTTLPATQEFDLVEGSAEPVEYLTRMSKFNNVRNINLHFHGNFSNGSDETTVF
ncbi:PITH domain-containing protein, partial [Smittium culicis]